MVLIFSAAAVSGLTYLLVKYTSRDLGPKAPKVEALNEAKAVETLNRLYNTLNVITLPPIKENVDLEAVDMASILPDIEKFPLQVGPVPDTMWVEIVSSVEKATPGQGGSDTNSWLLSMAEKFNEADISQKGRNVSVAIRALPSGLAMDYIKSGKYVPDAFTPSNILWGEALKASGIPAKLLAEKLIGNVAGIVIHKAKYDEFIRKYQTVDVKTLSAAVAEGSFVMGYTNPMASSTGANFLMSLLYSANEANPLSPESQQAFEKFQNNVPFVAYTTLQMTESAKSGALDGFVFELQQFVNSPDLVNNYVFTPFGVRHDSPVYALGNLERDKIELLTMFITYCRFPESQDLARKAGFNQNEAYPGEPKIRGQFLSMAQSLFKEKKTGNREIMAVFVADTSGSMAGAPLRLLKQSLIHGSKSIDSNNYIGLVQFSDQVQIAVPLQQFDLNQRSIFTGAVNNMSSGGGTAMYDGLITAEKMLHDAKPAHPSAKMMIIVLTDGESVNGYSFAETAPMFKGLKIPIYTIGYNANLAILEDVSALNEAASLAADTDDVVYQIQSFFNAEM